ncbi:MAG TPA: hypothetical protein VLD39_04620, partial [Gammaproteobacteria bacterium]|nr:hypothetical protein [Gammaproteobacteria bacterium]
MRNTLAVLHGTELYGGQDLDHAYRGCEIAADAALPARHSTWACAADAVGALLTDAGNADLSSIVPKSLVVGGTESVSRTAMRVLFRGRAKTLEFAARHLLGSDDFELSKADAGAVRDCDVLVTDHAAFDGGVWMRQPAIRVAPWLRQRAEIGPTWPETLQRLPRSLCKELRRWLGKRDYRARILSGMPAKLDFYE